MDMTHNSLGNDRFAVKRRQQMQRQPSRPLIFLPGCCHLAAHWLNYTIVPPTCHFRRQSVSCGSGKVVTTVMQVQGFGVRYRTSGHNDCRR